MSPATSAAKRILLLDTGKEWGGGTNSMLELLKRIDRSHYQVTALFYANYGKGAASDIGSELAQLGVTCRLLPQRRAPLWAKLAKELGRGLLGWHPGLRRRIVFAVDRIWRINPAVIAIEAVLREGFDLLYMNNQPSSNLEGYLAAEACGLPVIQHCRIAARVDPPEAAVANRVARRIVCVSQGVADTMTAQGISPQLCVVVPNGIDTTQPLPDGAASRAAWGACERDWVIGAVGSLIERKGLDCLIRAFAAAVRDNGMLRLVLVGEGPLRDRLGQLARSLGVAERVTFAGFHPRPLELIAGMDAMVLASSREGLPRVLLEGMLSGKPIVASDIPGNRELIADMETGLLFPWNDAIALGHCLVRLAQDPALARRLATAGRERVLRHYSMEQYVAGVERVWQECLGP